jgi:hypothetical protein
MNGPGDPTVDVSVDYIVLWVDDPMRSVAFNEHVFGFKGLRIDEFIADKAPFPAYLTHEPSISVTQAEASSVLAILFSPVLLHS